MKKDNKFLKKLFKYAKLDLEVQKKKADLDKNIFFGDLDTWNIIAIHRGCKIKDNILYSRTGEVLCDHNCMDDYVPNFTEEHIGYTSNDRWGTMYVQVNKSTFIAIAYAYTKWDIAEEIETAESESISPTVTSEK